MKFFANIIILFVLSATFIMAQTKNVGIGTTTPNASAILDLTATDMGLLIPRMTTAQRDAIASPALGLLIYNTTDNKFQFYYGGWVNSILTSAITSLNGLTDVTQIFGTGTSGTDFNISSAGTAHTFNIPDASATSRGLVTAGIQTIAGAKTLTSLLTFTGTATDITTGANEHLALMPNGTGNVGIGTSAPGQKLTLEGTLGILETGTTPTYHTIFQSGDQAADITYTLPTAAPTTNGQVLSSTTAGVMSWATGGGSGTSAISGLTVATANNTIDNTNYSQVWDWSTITTQNPLSLSANGITTGTILDITSSNNTVNSTNGLFRVFNNSASTNGIIFRAQSNSTAGTGLTVLASGNIGIGTVTPGSTLDIKGTMRYSGATSGNIEITAPATVTSYSLILPATQGSVSTYLQNDGSGNLSWATVGSGSASLSSLTAATAVNSINNANWAQTWNWNSATTEIPLTLSANAITTGTILDITSSYASGNSTTGLLRVANTGSGTSGIIFRAQSNSTAGSGLTVYADGNIGVATSTVPTSKLGVNGSIALPIKTVTADYTATADDYTILVDVNTATILLPQASTCAGRVYNIKKIFSGSGTITIDPYDSEQIEQADVYVGINAIWRGAMIQSDGSAWYIISNRN